MLCNLTARYVITLFYKFISKIEIEFFIDQVSTAEENENGTENEFANYNF